MFTGYGRGWQEEKATGKVSRLLQMLREPAGMGTYIAGFGVMMVSVGVATLVTAWINW